MRSISFWIRVVGVGFTDLEFEMEDYGIIVAELIRVMCIRWKFDLEFRIGLPGCRSFCAATLYTKSIVHIASSYR